MTNKMLTRTHNNAAQDCTATARYIAERTGFPQDAIKDVLEESRINISKCDPDRLASTFGLLHEIRRMRAAHKLAR